MPGQGDSNPNATLHSVANILQRYGITVNPQQDVTAKNSAAVMVTADISAFLKSGSRIDVTVASLGDAKALQGGVLLQTPLMGGDGHTYAVAQGAIAIGGFLGGQGGSGGATVQKNHPTVGTINNGAIVEREIPAQFVHNGDDAPAPAQPRFHLRRAHGHGDQRVLAAFGDGPRLGHRPGPPPPALHRPRGRLHLRPRHDRITPDTLARVVINERTGTIVATSTVRISEVAVADGSLTITVASNAGREPAEPLSPAGRRRRTQSTQTSATETKGSLIVLNDLPTIEQLAAAFNALGVSTREMMAIFQTLKRAGALQADLIIN